MARKAKGLTTHKVKLEFWRVEPDPNTGCDFKVALERCLGHPKVESRNVNTEGGVVRIGRVRDTSSDGVTGQMLRIRTDRQTKIGQLDADDERELRLAENEGLQETLHFGYFPEFRILVLRRNRDAGGINRLLNCLAKSGRCPGLGAYPQINADAVARLGRMRRVRKAELTVLPSGLDPKKGVGVDETITLGQRFGAMRVVTTLSMDHHKGGLLHEVVDAIRTTLAAYRDEVKTARLEGYADDNESMTVDLLSDKMQEEIRWQTAGPLTDEENADILWEGYHKRYQEIRSIYAP